MSDYIKSYQEISGVSKVRKEYFNKYSSLLIQYAHLKKDSIFVDVPCGSGEMTETIAKNNFGRKYYLIDVNPMMIKAARKHVSRNGIFMVGNAKDIAKLVPERVDGIFCLNGFHIYIDQKLEFLEGCYKILKQGGVLVFDLSTKGIHDRTSKNFLIKEAEEMKILAKKSGAKYIALKLADEQLLNKYRNMAIKAGFHVNKTIIFNAWVNVDDLIDETVRIPGRLRSRLLGIFDSQRIKIYKQANQIAKKKTGITLVKHSRIFFIAEKGKQKTVKKL